MTTVRTGGGRFFVTSTRPDGLPEPVYGVVYPLDFTTATQYAALSAEAARTRGVDVTYDVRITVPCADPTDRCVGQVPDVVLTEAAARVAALRCAADLDAAPDPPFGVSAPHGNRVGVPARPLPPVRFVAGVAVPNVGRGVRRGFRPAQGAP